MGHFTEQREVGFRSKLGEVLGDSREVVAAHFVGLNSGLKKKEGQAAFPAEQRSWMI